MKFRKHTIFPKNRLLFLLICVHTRRYSTSRWMEITQEVSIYIYIGTMQPLL